MAIHPPAAWRGYVTVFGAASALVAGAVGVLNYEVDPYVTHQWNTPEVRQLRPSREKLGAWGKTYALAKFRPSVVYIGNSRTELGLPTRTAVFPGKDVFNAGLSGASLGDAIAMVRHASAVSHLDTVVWGIDVASFSLDVGNTDFDRALVAGGRFYLARRVVIDMRRALTTDMTMASIRQLRGAAARTCRSSLAFQGQRDDACVRDLINGMGGTAKSIVPRLREYLRGGGPTAEAMAAFDASIGALCRAGSKVRLYINPTHATTAEVLYHGGKWRALEIWQGQLAALGQRHRAAGCDARIFDFSGFNSITTEPIPQVSGQPDMAYFWEASHHRVHVGAMVLSRMFGGKDVVPVDFGVELTPETVAAYQNEQRAARDRYQFEHPLESALARQVAAEASP